MYLTFNLHLFDHALVHMGITREHSMESLMHRARKVDSCLWHGHLFSALSPAATLEHQLLPTLGSMYARDISIPQG